MAPVATALYAPAAHDVHEAGAVASSPVLYRPAPQAVHSVLPLAAAYVPAAHAAQPTAPVVALLYVPTAHDVHPLVPSTIALNLPAAHAVHGAGDVPAATVL